jgi:hypothetical protein
MKNEIIIKKDVVFKKGDPELLRVESEKTSLAFSLFEDNPEFFVPKVIDYSETKGEIVYERIKDASVVGRFNSINSENVHVASQLGKFIAIVHSQYKLPDNMVTALPEELDCNDSKRVFIHGDLTGDNALYSHLDKKLYVIDWMMTRVHGGKATYGTAYFDIAWFLNFQFFSLFNLGYLKREIEVEADAFINSYFDSIDFPLSKDGFGRYLNKFIKYKINYRKKQLPFKSYAMLWWSHQRFLRYSSKFMN